MILNILAIIFMLFPLVEIILLIILWKNSLYLLFFLIALVIAILTTYLGIRFKGTGITPSCVVVAIYAISIMISLPISYMALILSFSRFIGVNILNNIDTYHFLFFSLPLCLISVLNLIYTRKGYFDEVISSKIEESKHNLVLGIFAILVMCLKHLSSIIRCILLIITAILKYILKTDMSFTSVMDAVVLSLAIDAMLKPYCKISKRVLEKYNS